MFAHVPQETKHIETLGPIQVIHDQRRVGTVEVDELTHLLPDTINPPGDHLGRIQLPLGRFEAGVANQPGRATD